MKPLSDEQNFKAVMSFLEKEHQRALFVSQTHSGHLVASAAPAASQFQGPTGEHRKATPTGHTTPGVRRFKFHSHYF